MKTKWQYTGDKNMLDYGGKNYRQSGNRQFQFVELTNMDEACGRDNKGRPKYHVSLRLVDLNEIKPGVQQRAWEYCGLELPTSGDSHETDTSLRDAMSAEACDSYGAHANLGQWSGNNARKLLRQAYREANALLQSDALESALDKPVNKIGSTAREMMKGDIFSAMKRGVESGDPSARLMAKIYGVPQQIINDERPADFLPYLFGYMAGLNGQDKETDPDTAKEYFRGYERGVNVRAGNCPAPGWIKQEPQALQAS